MLNDNGPAPGAQGKSSQQAQRRQQQQLLRPPCSQLLPPSFRDDNQTTQASPSRHVSQDYGAHQRSTSYFASPPPYHTPGPGPYGGRPQPPTLQQLPPNDLRSPSIATGGPSPYRQTPTSSVSGAVGATPSPPGQTPTSPVQQHQYPPQGVYHRDSYPQPSGAAVGITGPQGAPSYMQGQPVPQTPPVATPGGHPYLHQRSQSTHSTPTPTSAQSQGQYGAPFIQGSPVATHAFTTN